MSRLLILLFALLAAPAHATNTSKQEELSDLRSRIEQLKEDLGHATEDHAEASDALKDSEQNISKVNRTLRDLRYQERKLNRELARLASESDSAESELQGQQARLAELLKQRYRQGSEDAAKLLLSGQDPSAITRNVHYYAYIGRARAELISLQKQTLAQLANLQSEIQHRKSSLTSLREERQNQKTQLESEKTTRQSLLTKLSDQIKQQRKEISSLKRDEARLTRLIEKLRRNASVTKPGQKTVKPGQHVDNVATAALAGLNFAKLRGKLALPIAGEIIARYGQSRDGGGPSWKGLFIRAKTGNDVRAVASGEVVFSDWLRGFGNLLIVDHGDGYLSLYSNNESLYKQPGDAVRAGDSIATVGNTGGQEEPGLYFELRHQGKPFDPMNWVASR